MKHIKDILLHSNLGCDMQKNLFNTKAIKTILHTNAPPPLMRPEDFNLPKNQITAIQDYTRGSAFPLNYFKEHGKIPTYSDLTVDDIMDLDNNLRKGLSALPDMEGTFFRELGFGIEESNYFNGSYEDFLNFTKQLKKGNIYSPSSYMSTSIQEGLYTIPDAPYRAFLQIKGKTGKYIEGISNTPGDKEAIFLPKTNFKVIDTSWNPEKTYFWASLREE